MVKELRPMGAFTAYNYDSEGHLVSSTDANNKTTAYTYDAAGRVTAINYPAANGVPAKSVSFTYDANGNLLTYNDGITSGTYTYDANNRKLTDAVNYGAFTLSSSYTYYKNGQKKSFTGADGTVIKYTYDAANQLQTLNIAGEGTLVYANYKWTAPTKIILPGGGSKNYTYDALLRPTLIHMKDPAQNTLMRYAYAYDAAGNITVKNTEHGTYNYGYDIVDRLTSAISPTAQEAFAYDKVGNRIKHNSGSPWAYNANNELTSRPAISYQYDANGSQIQKTEGTTVTDYIYDGSNRLSKVKQGATTLASYAYDPFGRRISKTVNGTTTYYYYSDEGLAAEAVSSGTNGTGAITQTYGYAPNSIWGTDPIYTKAGGSYHYYLNDHLGTPQQLALKNGAKTWSAVYEAFGKATVTTSTITNNLRFPGQYADSETGLHYNWNRTYDNQIGRYIKADPIGIRGGVNGYLYTNSNPIIYIDNKGLVCVTLYSFTIPLGSDSIDLHKVDSSRKCTTRSLSGLIRFTGL